MIAPCYAGKILKVDLSTGKIEKSPLDERLTTQFLGGKGFGAKLLYDLLPPDTDAFDPDNKVIISTGPLTGTGAFSPKCNFAAKSPSTGGWLDCTLGGYFGPELKCAGFDVLVISGKAKEPVFIRIHDDEVEIVSSRKLWGKSSHEAESALKEELGDPKTRVASIGQAGENLVRFACVNGDLYRQAGRGGMGAVWGSKNLKAVAVRGTGKIGFSDRTGFIEKAKELNRYLKNNCAPLDTEGTMFLVDLMNENGMFPTHNSQKLVFKGSKKIDGQALINTIKSRDAACHGCVVHCGNVVDVKDGEFGPFQVEGPEYETACLLGANCGVDNLEAIAYLNLLCDRFGLDTISTGGTIAFAMECAQRGILTTKDLDGIDLQWGDYRAMGEIIAKIARREGVGSLLAEGSSRAAAEIGGNAPRYAMHVKGLEIPGYDPRGAVGMALAYAVADRGGCHLRAWTIYDEVVGDMDRFSTEGKATLVAARINRKALMDSIGMCEVMGLSERFAGLLEAATGWSVDMRVNADLPGTFIEDFLINGREGGVGRRISNLTRAFNVREGLGKEDDQLPDRYFEDTVAEGPVQGHTVSREGFEKMRNEFYRTCGWTPEGIPTRETLLSLELDNVKENLWPE